MAVMQGRGNSDPPPLGRDAAVEDVDLGGPARENVLQHARLVVVRLRDGLVHGLLRRAREHDPGPLADRHRLRDQPVDLPAEPGVGADAAYREPGQRRQGAGRGVENDFRPLRPPGVLERVRAQAALGEQPGQLLDLFIGAGRGSNGPNQESPGASYRTTPGATTAPAVMMLPRMTRGTSSAMTSSLPSPFCTLTTAASVQGRLRALHGRAGVQGLGGDDPEIARGQLAAFGSRMNRRDEVREPGDPQPTRLHRVHVLRPRGRRPIPRRQVRARGARRTGSRSRRSRRPRRGSGRPGPRRGPGWPPLR